MNKQLTINQMKRANAKFAQVSNYLFDKRMITADDMKILVDAQMIVGCGIIDLDNPVIDNPNQMRLFV